MNPQLLDYYNRELVYLRELGAEFAGQFPKVAARLGMNGQEVADPYVERLLEGFSFLTARIQMKMDAEFPQLSQRLLEVVHPNFLAPTPAMAVVQFEPSMNEGSLAAGFTLPRGTLLRGHIPRGEQTPCEFATGHEVRLWPLRVVHAELSGIPAYLPLARMGLPGRGAAVRAALRIGLEVCGGNDLEELGLDRLAFYLNGADLPMQALLALLMGRAAGVVCHDAGRPLAWHRLLGPDALRQEGLGDDQALLPCEARAFQGYRLLQEYFAFPARYQFFSIGGLKDALAAIAAAGRSATRRFDITVLLTQRAPELEGVIDARHLALHCSPVVNLFARRADRIAVSPRTSEYHVVVDRSRPLDFEVYALQSVCGHEAGNAGQKAFRPFYGSPGEPGEQAGAYYSVRREPRLLSGSAQRNGPRTGYTGSEVFVSLVDQDEAPFSDSLRHLSIQALCTNRDLPMLMALDGESDFSLRISAPVSRIKVLRGPSRPRPALAGDAATWNLVSHLGLNYLSLTDMDDIEGARSLRELLTAYGNLADPVVRKQIDGLVRASVQPVCRRLPASGPILYGRGVRIALQVDEAAFSGVSPYLLGAVLERFFARHVAINTFTELSLATLQRGELAYWPPRMGLRPAA